MKKTAHPKVIFTIVFCLCTLLLCSVTQADTVAELQFKQEVLMLLEEKYGIPRAMEHYLDVYVNPLCDFAYIETNVTDIKERVGSFYAMVDNQHQIYLYWSYDREVAWDDPTASIWTGEAFTKAMARRMTGEPWHTIIYTSDSSVGVDHDFLRQMAFETIQQRCGNDALMNLSTEVLIELYADESNAQWDRHGPERFRVKCQPEDPEYGYFYDLRMYADDGSVFAFGIEPIENLNGIYIASEILAEQAEVPEDVMIETALDIVNNQFDIPDYCVAPKYIYSWYEMRDDKVVYAVIHWVDSPDESWMDGVGCYYVVIDAKTGQIVTSYYEPAYAPYG